MQPSRDSFRWTMWIVFSMELTSPTPSNTSVDCVLRIIVLAVCLCRLVSSESRLCIGCKRFVCFQCTLAVIPAVLVSKRFTTTASELGMSDDKETPLGVKMLADHLVKVKMQYEGGNWEDLVLIE